MQKCLRCNNTGITFAGKVCTACNTANMMEAKDSISKVKFDAMQLPDTYSRTHYARTLNRFVNLFKTEISQTRCILFLSPHKLGKTIAFTEANNGKMPLSMDELLAEQPLRYWVDADKLIVKITQLDWNSVDLMITLVEKRSRRGKGIFMFGSFPLVYLKTRLRNISDITEGDGKYGTISVYDYHNPSAIEVVYSE